MKPIAILRSLGLFFALVAGLFAQRAITYSVTGNSITGTGTVAIMFAAQGDENAIGLTLTYDPTVFRYKPRPNDAGTVPDDVSKHFGTGINGASLNLNTATAGKVGIALAKSAGTTFPSGNLQLVLVDLEVIASTSGSTSIGFSDSPVAREVVSATVETLTTIYTPLTVAASPQPVAPTITTQPSAQSVNQGASATFSVTASGMPAPTYRWQKDGVDIQSATAASYTIAAVATSDAGSYRCVVTNSQGSVTSNAAVLTVAAAAAITTQPSSLTKVQGETATLSVVATGGGTLTYLWMKGPLVVADGTMPSGSVISGATTATLSISNVQAAEAGAYTCRVSNFTSVESSPATLTVNIPPTISTQPASQSGFVGGTATFTVTAAGTSPLSFQWKKNGSAISGATSSSYTTPTLALTDNGAKYTVTVTNVTTQTVTSSEASLTVTVAPFPPSFTTQPAPSTKVAIGKNATLSVVVNGNPTPTLQWKKNGTDISGATAASLDLTNVQAGDAGSYTVVATNSEGTATSNSGVIVPVVPPSITTQPAPSTTVLVGSNVSLFVVAAGDLPLAYQWKKGSTSISGATAASLALSNVALTDTGDYSVVVSNTDVNESITSSTAAVSVQQEASITTQPAPATTVNDGSNVTLSVVATGTPAPSYQWKRDGVDLTGKTTATLALTNVQKANAGVYTVVVSNTTVNGVKTVTSSDATVTVNVRPSITTQPASATVDQGQPASFSVVAAGEEPFTYQWRKNGTNISGATSSTFSISATTAADAGAYSVVVNNVTGVAATSSNATLTIETSPVITSQPGNRSVEVGQSASFSVIATGKAPMSYQWKKGTETIAGATSSVLTLNSVRKLDDRSVYTVTITNALGSTTSSAATLTVIDPPSIPKITSQPKSTTVSENATVVLTVSASANPTPTFQWRKDGVAISGATGATMIIDKVKVADGGNYDVVVANAQGSVTSDVAVVKVNGSVAPSIVTQPAGQTVSEGGSVTFTVVADGNPSPAYQWRKGGDAIAGATAASLVLTNVQASAAGDYSVVVSNVAGSVNSSVAKLTVNPKAVAPTIVTQPANVTVTVGQAAVLSVVADGTPAPTYQWRKDGVAVAGATSASLSITNAQTFNAGSYTVIVTNSAGSVTSASATLTVSVPVNAPKISGQPVGASVTVGGTAVFAVVADGNPAPTYQWRKNGASLSGATNPSLALSSVQAGDAGTYDVVVSNAGGTATSAPAKLEVKPADTAPVITKQPVGRTVVVGASVSLTVDVTGNPAPNYQWRKGGAAIAGAISANYAIAAAVEADAGSYDVVVTNSLGSATSTAATIVVNPAPVAPTIKEQPTSTAAIVGQAARFQVVAVGNPAPTFQWRKNGANIAGATAAAFSISAAQTTDEASYDVLVANSEGSVASAIARLTVNPAPVAPEIFAQPRSISVVSGRSASFRVGASGAPAPTIQWRRNGVPIAGATSANYVISNAVAGDAGAYSAVVTNSAGSVTSSSANLTVMRRSYAGTYFGNLGPLGFFSIFIREDNTGIFLGFLSGTSTPFVSRGVFVDDNGRFTFSASTPAGRVASASAIEGTGAGGFVAATDDFVFSGIIGENGSLSGSVSGAQSLPMAASRSADTGASASKAGFYEASVAGSSAATYTIVSPTGQAMVLTTTTSGADAGTGTADAAGKVQVTTVNNQTVTATVSADATQIAATVKDSSGKELVFTGASDEVLAAQRLVNVSTRSRSSTGNNVAIAGFVIGGEESKTVLIRAVGPTLAKFGVSGAMTSPKLELYQGAKVIGTNSGWATAKNAAEMSAAAKRALAFDLEANSLDAVIYTTLAPGSYTAAVSNNASTDGVALVEVYDLSAPSVGQKLLNISTRSVVGTGENMMIAGFVVSGSVPKRVLIRGVGPSLASYGLTASTLLARPQVELLRGSTRVAINSGYAASADAAAIVSASAQVGAFPLANNNEAALLLSLEPGSYTAQVSGVGGTSGIAIIEVYEVP